MFSISVALYFYSDENFSIVNLRVLKIETIENLFLSPQFNWFNYCFIEFMPGTECLKYNYEF